MVCFIRLFPSDVSLEKIRYGELSQGRRLSRSCKLSLATGFSPVGAVGVEPSRFNGFASRATEKTVKTVSRRSAHGSPG